MSVQKLFAVPTVIVSLALTFAPVLAQDAGNSGSAADRATVGNYDRDNGPQLGWLGLIGLVGLSGLMRRNQDNDTNRGRVSHT